MIWKTFIYKNDEDESFARWIARVATVLRAEQLLVINKTEIVVYFPNNYDDELNENGQYKS